MIFLKLGGSLITDKTRPETCRQEVLFRLAQEIAEAKGGKPKYKIVLGHGSGSFGHVAAARHGTIHGVSSPSEWRGFAEVWNSARRLNRLVIDALIHAELPAVAFPPSASAICKEGLILEMAIEPINRALEADLLPVVYGDVAFDQVRGATIISTETIFSYLATALQPERILLAGIEHGVYADYPNSEEILLTVSKDDLPNLNLEESTATDVTGGMRGKVEAAVAMACAYPDLEVRIFSGVEAGVVGSMLLGGEHGTLVTA